MRLLIYDWTSFLQYDVYSVLDELKIDYDKFSFDFSKDGHDKNYDEEFVIYFKENFSSQNYDAIFSIAYWAALSDAAMETNMKYISWSYDCPLDTKNPMRTLNNPCNYIFLFDKIQADSYISAGLDTVYYMPLGINKNRYLQYDSYKRQCDPYRNDISFVGNLYMGSTDGIKSLVSEKTRSLFDQIIETQKKFPDKYILNDIITDSFIDAVNKEIETLHPNIAGNLSKENTANTFAYEITNYNRMILLMLLGKRHNTALYTATKIDTLSNVIIKEPVNYLTEMPWVFAGSKINLNSTFISIQSGLPLRVLDIMASGGFLLSNKQGEFDSLGYKDNEDVALFSSFDEAVSKADYYLSHENQRALIAKNGKKKVFENHNLKDKMIEMMKICGVNN